MKALQNQLVLPVMHRPVLHTPIRHDIPLATTRRADMPVTVFGRAHDISSL